MGILDMEKFRKDENSSLPIGNAQPFHQPGPPNIPAPGDMDVHVVRNNAHGHQNGASRDYEQSDSATENDDVEIPFGTPPFQRFDACIDEEENTRLLHNRIQENDSMIPKKSRWRNAVDPAQNISQGHDLARQCEDKNERQFQGNASPQLTSGRWADEGEINLNHSPRENGSVSFEDRLSSFLDDEYELDDHTSDRRHLANSDVCRNM